MLVIDLNNRTAVQCKYSIWWFFQVWKNETWLFMVVCNPIYCETTYSYCSRFVICLFTVTSQIVFIILIGKGVLRIFARGWHNIRAKRTLFSQVFPGTPWIATRDPPGPWTQPSSVRDAPWYFNKMVLQNTLRSDVSAILKSIHVRDIVQEFVWVSNDR